MKIIQAVSVAIVIAVSYHIFYPIHVSALSLRMQPLMYKNSLKEGEKKKGFIDISNVSGSKQNLVVSVQSFRQINDKGDLEFFKNDDITKGITTDIDSAELNAGETLRLFFTVDSASLPKGDVFAVIFVKTDQQQTRGSAQNVRLGTLLFLENGNASSREIKVRNLDTPVLYAGEGIWATFGLHNPAREKTNSGFFPVVTVDVWPFQQTKVTGPFVAAGRTRTVDFDRKGAYLGVVRVEIKAGKTSESRWALAITGFYRFLLPLMVLCIVLVIIVIKKLVKNDRLQYNLNHKHIFALRGDRG